jgi:hypothetical protein
VRRRTSSWQSGLPLHAFGEVTVIHAFRLAAFVMLPVLLSPIVMAAEPNTLTADEKAAGFDLLFDGKDLSGWKQGGNWKVEDGTIAREGKGGSLVYEAKKMPDDFELRFEWKVGEGSNSGVYYRPTQYEYQILDNARHRDGQNPRTSAASLYFCMAPAKDATRPVGEWNEGRVVCKGTVIQHWLNGEKVVDLDYTDPKYAFEVALLKARGGDLTARGANLNLQDHGDPVWYRSIKLRELGADETLDRTPITPAAIPPEMLQREKEKLEAMEKKKAK